MIEVRVEGFIEYPEAGADFEGWVVLDGMRAVPMPFPERSVCLKVGPISVDLTREGALEIAAALKEAACDG